jgi:hypothetical protein
MKTLDIPQDLQDKMLRRAQRAFALYDEGKDEHVTRCSDVTQTSLRYRISHRVAGTSGYYSGPKVLIERIFPKSKWWNPLTWGKKGEPTIIVPAKVGDDEHIIDHAAEPKALPMKGDAKAIVSGLDALTAAVDGIKKDDIDQPGDPHKTITMLPPPPDVDHQYGQSPSNTLPDVDGPDADLTHIESI